MFSGVYYLKQPEDGGNLLVYNPLMNVHGYLTKNPRGKYPGISQGATIKSREGEIIIFPSWLEHSTEPNKSDEDRIAISFNLTLEPYNGLGPIGPNKSETYHDQEPNQV